MYKIFDDLFNEHKHFYTNFIFDIQKKCSFQNFKYFRFFIKLKRKISIFRIRIKITLRLKSE